MKHKDSRSKSFTQKAEPNDDKTQDDSITNVHFSEYFNKQWKDGKRLPISIRQNNKLYVDFKPIAQRLYGSVCRAIETFEAAVIAASEHNVHFCNTEKPINIEKIVIERNLRPRRRLDFVEEHTEEVEISVVERGSESTCAFCDRKPVVRGFYLDGSKVWLCHTHFRERRLRLERWRDLE